MSSSKYCVHDPIAGEIIYLTEDQSCWVKVDFLPDSLKQYAREHFNELFMLHSPEKGRVVVQDTEIESPRFHSSYGNTPSLDPSRKNSHMFSGFHPEKQQQLPAQFECFLEYANSLYHFNQIVANWYEDGSQFIAPHSDCQIGMAPNAVISALTLTEEDSQPRLFSLISKSKKGATVRHLKLLLKHGCFLTMGGETQERFLHAVLPTMSAEAPRLPPSNPADQIWRAEDAELNPAEYSKTTCNQSGRRLSLSFRHFI